MKAERVRAIAFLNDVNIIIYNVLIGWRIEKYFGYILPNINATPGGGIKTSVKLQTLHGEFFRQRSRFVGWYDFMGAGGGGGSDSTTLAPPPKKKEAFKYGRG
jgi:hypothetical protein